MNKETETKSFGQCPHPLCETVKPRNMYACKMHWLGLPNKIKEKISTGFRHSAKTWREGHFEALEYWNNEKV